MGGLCGIGAKFLQKISSAERKDMRVGRFCPERGRDHSLHRVVVSRGWNSETLYLGRDTFLIETFFLVFCSVSDIKRAAASWSATR